MKVTESGDPLTTRPMPRWAILFAAWTVFGITQTIVGSLLMMPFDWSDVRSMAIQFLPRVWMWAAITPAITAWDAIVRRRTTSIFARVAFHIPLFIIAALIQVVIRRTIIVALGSTLSVPFYVTFLYFLDVEAVRYVACLMLGLVLKASDDLASRERKESALKEEIGRAQLHYLDLQLQPHFLFNALASIAELAHEAPAIAAMMVAHLTSLLRYATDAGSGREVTLRQELAALYPYLELQRMRFPDWLSIVERIEPGAAEAMVPRMLLQPLVENAIRHGLSQRQSGGLIEFAASVHAGDLLLSVHDNGAGLKSPKGMPGLGIGLTNIRDRLSTLYGNRQSLELRSRNSGGVEVLLRIPYTRAPVAPVHDAVAISASESVEEPSDPPARPSASPASLLGGWAIAGVILTILSLTYVFIRHPNDHEPALDIIRRHAIHAGLWMLLTPAVFFLARNFPIARGRLLIRLPLHVVAAVAVAIAHLALARLAVGGEQPPLFAGIFMDSIFWNLVAYGVLVAIVQRDSIEAWIRERDVAAARMRAELTSAKLSSMMLELRPEFLLSALASLQQLVMVDVSRAEKLLISFADFLRLTLDSLGTREITVEKELALLESYATLHNAGAGFFPELDVESAPEIEKRLVPTGIMRTMTDRLLESIGPQERLSVDLRDDKGRLTMRFTPSDLRSSSVEFEIA